MKIHAITAPNPGPFTLDGTRTYVLDGVAVIDPGPDERSHLDAMLEAAPRLRTILITHRHPDHAPAAEPLKRMTGARVIAPRDVLSDFVVDERIEGGERILIGDSCLEVIATPGHTREHVCFLSSDGELFSGDTILGSGTTAVIPPDGNMSDYIRSLETLLARQPRRIFPAHGPVRDDADTLIRAYITHRLLREREVLESVEGGAATIPLLRERIYPDLDASLHRAAEIQLWAHLIKLVDDGRVSERDGRYALLG